MGCDIHIYTEVKINNKWTCIDKLKRVANPLEDVSSPYINYTAKHIYDGRNYVLFGALSGVRDSWVRAIDSARGFPKDMSDIIHEISDFDYEHSASWLTLEDLKKYRWWNNDKYTKSRLYYFFSRQKKYSTINKLIGLQKKYNVTPQDIRIVFWFDS